MDKASVSFDTLTSCSAYFIGVKSILVVMTANEKNSFTVELFCMAYGDR